MRNAHGYAVITGPDGLHQEFDTLVCRHCNRISHLRPKQRPEDYGGFCSVCSGLVCPSCVGKGCDPLEKKLERAEASYHARRSYGI